MKETEVQKIRRSLFPLLFISALATAQIAPRITSGGFGHFTGGPAYTDVSFLNTLIGPGTPENGSYSVENPGLMFGGEGFGLRNRWFFGGGGFALYMRSAQAAGASVNFGMGGGYFKTGYLILERSRSFAYCFGSIGGGDMALTIKNRDAKDFIVNDQTRVSPLSTNKFKMGAVFFDAGVGAKFLVTPVAKDATSCGGLLLGIDLGCKIGSPVGNWQLKNKSVYLSALPTQVMPYVRLTLGGGLFKRD
jgi:hypothetical protein